MHPIRVTILVLLTALPLSSLSFACRSSHSPQAVLLETVPDEAQGASVIARVVIKEIYTKDLYIGGKNYNHTYAKAQIVQAIKGVDLGQNITIRASLSFCSSALYQDDVGRDGFVAGNFELGDSIYETSIAGFWDLRYSRNKVNN